MSVSDYDFFSFIISDDIDLQFGFPLWTGIMDIAEVEENLFAASDAKVWTVYTNWLNLNGAFGSFVEFFHWILDSLLFILLNSTILLFIDKGAFLFTCLVVVSLCINALCMPAHFRSTNVLSQVDKDSLDFYAN